MKQYLLSLACLRTIDWNKQTFSASTLFMERPDRAPLNNRSASPSREIWQKSRKYAEQRQIRAQVVNEFNAIMVREFAEYSGANSGHAEGEAEEKAGYGSHSAGYEFLREHEYG